MIPPLGAPRALSMPMSRVFSETIIDRKSTRLNSSHQIISYAVFCLKKKTHQRHALHRGLLLDRRHAVPPRAQPLANVHARRDPLDIEPLAADLPRQPPLVPGEPSLG